MVLQAEQIEFSRSVEALFIKALGPDISAPIKAALKEAGLDLDRPLLPGYPARQFHKWVQIVATMLFPNLVPSEALRQIGQRATRGNEETVIGRAIVAALKLIGPKRTLQRLDRIFRNNNNYQNVAVSELTELSATVTIGQVFSIPTYYQGLLETGVQYTGALNPRVTLVSYENDIATIHMTWDAHGSR